LNNNLNLFGKGRPGRPRHTPAYFGDFDCRHCGLPVSSLPLISGVRNRNHCPFCLWSLHLDWWTPGDRLSACKSPMRPLGLTVKLSRKKYAAPQSGELMLIHQCQDCGGFSINRLAADDDAETLQALFRQSQRLPLELRVALQAEGISLLQASDWPRFERQFAL
jgi:hypothetical protein